MEKFKADIRLKVKNERSIAFYRSIGFTICSNVITNNPVQIANEDSSFNLSLVTESLCSEETSETYVMIQIGYSNTKEVDEAFFSVLYNGFTDITKPWNTFWGTRSAKVLDPDGHNILLYTNLV